MFILFYLNKTNKICQTDYFDIKMYIIYTSGSQPVGRASRGGASRLQDGRKKNLKKKICKFFLSLNYCHKKL